MDPLLRLQLDALWDAVHALQRRPAWHVHALSSGFSSEDGLATTGEPVLNPVTVDDWAEDPPPTPAQEEHARKLHGARTRDDR